MEIEFRKDLKHNYMVIKAEENFIMEPYCIKMLEQPVEGILPMEQHFMDNQFLYYYDITAKQSMVSLLEKMVLTYDKIYQIISKLLAAMEIAYEYLLPEDDFIISPEFIYLDVRACTPSICFLSGYKKDLKEQLKLLFEYLMNKVDYHDKDAVYLIYQLYAVSREENTTFHQFYEVLQKHKEERTEQKTITDQKPSETPCEEMQQKAARRQKNNDPNIIRESSSRKRNQKINSSPYEISVMMEKLESETEVFYYPWKTYVLTAGSILAGIGIAVLGFLTKILYNFYGNRLDYSKLVALLLILLCGESYLFKRIWDKKHRLTRIKKKCEYINPIEEDSINSGCRKKIRFLGEQIRNTVSQESEKIIQLEDIRKTRIKQDKKTDNLPVYNTQDKKYSSSNYLLEGEEDRPTCLLNEKESNLKIILKPLEEDNYITITIFDFPFFVGKLKKNVDYCLEKDVVSRFHAKITTEQGKYYITDLNSTNGTYVNQEAVPTYQKKELQFGDEIAFANIRYRFLQI